jgi:hypothetical protein
MSAFPLKMAPHLATLAPRLRKSALRLSTGAYAAARTLFAFGAKIGGGIRYALVRFAAINAEARMHQARLETELHRNRYRLRTKTDDALPTVS